jgi:hypothetical protein
MSFTAKLQGNAAANPGVLCNWSTASEDNSADFIVQRSNNGRDFVPVGRVSARGNSSGMHHYSFVDNTPLNGISYYRLKMVDVDAKFSYSKIVAVAAGQPETLFTIYPNPVKNEATLAVAVTKKQSVMYTIIDHVGKKVLSTIVTLNEGLNTISLPVSSLPAGVYIVQLKGSSFVNQAQFIKP